MERKNVREYKRKAIPYMASMVNNITNQMVKDAPHFDKVLELFLDFIGDDPLVGHNICSFDMKFIYRDCERYLGQTISNDYIDTLHLAKKVFPKWKHRRLCDLAEYYGISTEGAHRALADCKMNQIIFEYLGKELNNQCLTKKKNMKICPVCHRPMIIRNGRYGEFWGCTGFPMCRHTENVM